MLFQSFFIPAVACLASLARAAPTLVTPFTGLSIVPQTDSTFPYSAWTATLDYSLLDTTLQQGDVFLLDMPYVYRVKFQPGESSLVVKAPNGAEIFNCVSYSGAYVTSFSQLQCTVGDLAAAGASTGSLSFTVLFSGSGNYGPDMEGANHFVSGENTITWGDLSTTVTMADPVEQNGFYSLARTTTHGYIEHYFLFPKCDTKSGGFVSLTFSSTTAGQGDLYCPASSAFLSSDFNDWTLLKSVGSTAVGTYCDPSSDNYMAQYDAEADERFGISALQVETDEEAEFQVDVEYTVTCNGLLTSSAFQTNYLISEGQASASVFPYYFTTTGYFNSTTLTSLQIDSTSPTAATVHVYTPYPTTTTTSTWSLPYATTTTESFVSETITVDVNLPAPTTTTTTSTWDKPYTTTTTQSFSSGQLTVTVDVNVPAPTTTTTTSTWDETYTTTTTQSFTSGQLTVTVDVNVPASSSESVPPSSESTPLSTTTTTTSTWTETYTTTTTEPFTSGQLTVTVDVNVPAPTTTTTTSTWDKSYTTTTTQSFTSGQLTVTIDVDVPYFPNSTYTPSSFSPSIEPVEPSTPLPLTTSTTSASIPPLSSAIIESTTTTSEETVTITSKNTVTSTTTTCTDETSTLTPRSEETATVSSSTLTSSSGAETPVEESTTPVEESETPTPAEESTTPTPVEKSTIKESTTPVEKSTSKESTTTVEKSTFQESTTTVEKTPSKESTPVAKPTPTTSERSEPVAVTTTTSTPTLSTPTTVISTTSSAIPAKSQTNSILSTTTPQVPAYKGAGNMLRVSAFAVISSFFLFFL